MSIEAATGLISLLIAVATTFISLFVNNRIMASEARTESRHQAYYMSRDAVLDRFREVDRRFDDHIETYHARTRREA